MHKKIIIETIKKQERKNVKKWDNKDYLLNTDNHIQIVNQLYLEQSFTGSVCAKHEIIRKLNSYKQQDIKKNKYSSDFIQESELLEKLVISKLKCYYCKKKVILLYENSREPIQWTLDRLNNDMGHTNDNVVICCLKCNLERRCLNDDKFLFTKQMRLIKLNEL
jgi:hypothetical protein